MRNLLYLMKIDKQLNILVIGSGMYTTGRGTRDFGTIMPAIFEWQRSENLIGKVIIASTNANSSIDAKKRIKEMEDLTNIKLNVECIPKSGTDSESYIDAINQIPRPAIAVVAVPDHLHYQICKDCLIHDLFTIVVKPLTPRLDEAIDLADLAKKKNLLAYVEFHKRLDEANMIMKDRFLKGNIGTPLYSIVEYSQRKSIPSKVFSSWADKSNILQYLGIHYIDLMRFVTKARPVRVMATGQKAWLVERKIETYDSIQCLIEWEYNDNSFIQAIHTNWIDPETSSAMSNQKIKFIGTEGRIESEQKDRGIKINIDNQCLEQPNPYFCYRYKNSDGYNEWRGYGINSFKQFFSDSYSIFFKNKEVGDYITNRPTFEEAIYSSAVIEAANKSLVLNSEWVEVFNE